MSYNAGYVTVAHSSYSEWKAAINGNGWNVDGLYGCQCYDLALLFWWNVGFPQGYPVSTGITASGIWDRRNDNIGYGGTVYFELIYDLNNVVTGDILVYSGTPSNEYGHIGFADQDYASWHAENPSSYEFPILSENNGGTPDPDGGAYANVHGYDTRLFRGAFRYKEWHQPAPTPSYTSGRSGRLPLILATRRLINPNSML